MRGLPLILRISVVPLGLGTEQKRNWVIIFRPNIKELLVMAHPFLLIAISIVLLMISVEWL